MGTNDLPCSAYPSEAWMWRKEPIEDFDNQIHSVIWISLAKVSGTPKPWNHPKRHSRSVPNFFWTFPGPGSWLSCAKEPHTVTTHPHASDTAVDNSGAWEPPSLCRVATWPQRAILWSCSLQGIDHYQKIQFLNKLIRGCRYSVVFLSICFPKSKPTFHAGLEPVSQLARKAASVAAPPPPVVFPRFEYVSTCFNMITPPKIYVIKNNTWYLNILISCEGPVVPELWHIYSGYLMMSQW